MSCLTPCAMWYVLCCAVLSRFVSSHAMCDVVVWYLILSHACVVWWRVLSHRLMLHVVWWCLVWSCLMRCVCSVVHVERRRDETLQHRSTHGMRRDQPSHHTTQGIKTIQPYDTTSHNQRQYSCYQGDMMITHHTAPHTTHSMRGSEARTTHIVRFVLGCMQGNAYVASCLSGLVSCRVWCDMSHLTPCVLYIAVCLTLSHTCGAMCGVV